MERLRIPVDDNKHGVYSSFPNMFVQYFRVFRKGLHWGLKIQILTSQGQPMALCCEIGVDEKKANWNLSNWIGDGMVEFISSALVPRFPVNMTGVQKWMDNNRTNYNLLRNRNCLSLANALVHYFTGVTHCPWIFYPYQYWKAIT